MTKIDEIKQALAAKVYESGYIQYLEKLVFAQAAEDDRLRKELEEARKETEFHRNAAKIYRKATSDIHNTLRWGDSENALERVETIIELAQVQEGEGNQRTIEVTLHNEGYKKHELKFEEQGEIEVENKLTLWYNIEKREVVIESVKANIQKRYGFSDGEIVSSEGGFKFLFDDETSGEIEITFIEANGNLKVTVNGTWPWEVIEIYNHCLPQSAEEDPA
ncbi:hypothetical protein D3C75_395880 [compost metagenome]